MIKEQNNYKWAGIVLLVTLSWGFLIGLLSGSNLFGEVIAYLFLVAPILVIPFFSISVIILAGIKKLLETYFFKGTNESKNSFLTVGVVFVFLILISPLFNIFIYLRDVIFNDPTILYLAWIWSFLLIIWLLSLKVVIRFFRCENPVFWKRFFEPLLLSFSLTFFFVLLLIFLLA